MCLGAFSSVRERHLTRFINALPCSQRLLRHLLVFFPFLFCVRSRAFSFLTCFSTHSSPSSEEVTSPTLPRVRSLSDEECMVRLAGTLANRNTTNTTVQSESTTSFNNININITNSSTSSVTDVKLSTTTLTQPQSSLHAIAAAASIVATSTTTTAVAATATTTAVMTPASPNVNNKRRKLESNSSNNSNLNVNVKVDVSFEENVSGCKKTIDYDCFVLCDKCSGTGKVTDGNSNSGSGKGVGEEIACTQCNGMVWKTKKRLEVDIPPNGVKNGFKKVCIFFNFLFFFIFVRQTFWDIFYFFGVLIFFIFLFGNYYCWSTKSQRRRCGHLAWSTCFVPLLRFSQSFPPSSVSFTHSQNTTNRRTKGSGAKAKMALVGIW